MRKGTLLVAAALVVLGSASSSSAQPTPSEDSLELTHETLANAVKAGNVTLLQGLIHRSALGFFQDSQMLVQLGADYGPQQAIGPVVADISRFVTTTYQINYRVVGDTGLVCLSSAMKDAKGVTNYVRVTYVYVFADGNWRLLSWHSSQVPLKR